MPRTDTMSTKPALLVLLLVVLLVTDGLVLAGMNKEIQYLSWDGSRWTALHEKDRFKHSPERASRQYFDAVIRFIGWDGSKLAARWEREEFLIAPYGDFSSGRTWRRDHIAFQGWDGLAWTAQWRPQSQRFEVNRAAGVMIVVPSARLNSFKELNSRHRVCGGRYSKAALDEYLKDFSLSIPHYIQLSTGDYFPALQKGVCQAIIIFATREFARKYAENFAAQGGFNVVEIP